VLDDQLRHCEAISVSDEIRKYEPLTVRPA